VRKELWYEKAACNILVNLSHIKVLCTAFKCLQFGFVIFWRKDFGAKAANQMLVKLTPSQSWQWGQEVISKSDTEFQIFQI
jgi:hypothetical protein